MDPKLKTRIITALGYGVVVLTLLYIGPYTRALLWSFAGGAAIYEYCKMVQVSIQRIWMILIAWASILILFATGQFSQISITLILLVISFVSIFSVLRAIFNKGAIIEGPPYSLMIYPGGMSWIMCYYCLQSDNASFNFLLSILLIVWASDSFAYLVGRKIGKHKMSDISPNKTWEGTIGGIVAGVLVALTFQQLLPSVISAIHWIALGIIISVGTVMGDLLESAVKRKYNAKDSGYMLPGHGGFFDRFDSLIFVLPLVYLYLTISKII